MPNLQGVDCMYRPALKPESLTTNTMKHTSLEVSGESLKVKFHEQMYAEGYTSHAICLSKRLRLIYFMPAPFFKVHQAHRAQLFQHFPGYHVIIC